MDWPLFWISSVLWVFFFEHFLWLKRFEAMGELGMRVPVAMRFASKGLAMITMVNLLAFLLIYGFKISWLWATAIVIGGYAGALAFSVLVRGSQGTMLHKLGWVGMPILSAGIWVAAFVA